MRAGGEPSLSARTARATKLLARVGIPLAGTVTTEFVMELLDALDEHQVRGTESDGIVQGLLDTRPGWERDLADDEPTIGSQIEGGERLAIAAVLPAVIEFGRDLIAAQREARIPLVELEPSTSVNAVDRREALLLALATHEASSPEWMVRANAARRLGALRVSGDDVLRRLAADPHPKVADVAQAVLLARSQCS